MKLPSVDMGISRADAPANSGPKMWMGYDGDGTSAPSPGPRSTHITRDDPSLAPMVLMPSCSGSSDTPKRRWYRSASARRSLGMPRLAEYRWLRVLWAAPHSLSTATAGDGRSGGPDPGTDEC